MSVSDQASTQQSAAAEELPFGFYALAAADPERVAIIDPDGTLITAGELHGRVNRRSRALLALGLEAGDRVAAVVHNGHEYLELMLATGQLGMFMVQVNWHLTPNEMIYIIEDSGAKAIVAAAEQARILPGDSLSELRYVVGEPVEGWTPFEDLGADESSAPPEGRRFGAHMGYTSGTTGRPKGVRPANLPDIEPEIILELVYGTLAKRYGLPRTGVHLVCSPIYHSAPSAHAVAFLHAGHTIVIQSKFEPEAVLAAIETHGVTSVHLVPTHFHRLLKMPDDVRSTYDVSSLQAVVHAGAPCPVAVKHQMLDWFGPIVWEYLAASEGWVCSVSPQEWIAKPGTVGRPGDDVAVKIIGDDGEEQPAGEPGTIYFNNLAMGGRFEYHNNAEKTEASRKGDLGTVGDYGYFDEDGYLFLLDRRTDVIISGGVNIYPAEIEHELQSHPSVNDAAVIGVPDPEWGQRTLGVVQLVSGVEPSDILAQDIREHCAKNLASFKVPKQIEFVDEFPRTETGKLQRRRLRDKFIPVENP
ncbi:AMP-binding protein [Nocardia sp. 348MFTsu5.1]|uniref:AMP-binding protein n=1 Tax=Nocardia sp. 348MFTsu5.1 TaxID=1172185 RepID=UPI000368DEEC|nr:AMP-binding protein [Nocardia sp. 348MFTsu5.1]